MSSASQLFPRASLGFLTATLTAVTLFFGELLPKAFAVANSETVTRLVRSYIRIIVIPLFVRGTKIYVMRYLQFVPMLMKLSVPLRPITEIVNFLR